MQFQVGDKVFLKVLPTKGIKRFRVRGKLSPRYIRPHEIIEKLNPVAYRLDLPVELEHVHNAFHISQLRKYTSDPNQGIVPEPIEIRVGFVFEEQTIQILDRGLSSCATSRYL